MHLSTETRTPEQRLDRRLGRILFALAFVSYAYFMQAGGWNHNSRLDVALALVEEHTVRIDDYGANTGDMSYFGGHYYSDKAPLTGVLAAIPYYPVYLARPLLPDALQDGATFYRIASYVVTLCVSGLAAALTTLLLFKFARRSGGTPRAAAAIAIAYAVASPAFPFATVLFGHDLAAALLFGSFTLACAPDGGWKRYFCAGIIGSLAVVAEYPTVGASVVFVCCLLWSQRRQGWWRLFAPYAAGALLPVFCAAAYAWICFRDIFSLGYRHVSFGEISKVSAFGLSYPHPAVVVDMLFGERRGLFVVAPILFLCATGLVAGMVARKSRRAWMWPAAAVCIFNILFISSFRWWDGGASFGPRHLIPMLPFLCLGGLAVAERFPRTFAGVTALSALLQLAGTGQTPIPSPGAGIIAILYQVYIGVVPNPEVQGVIRVGESTNAGLLAGLHATWSLAPLIVIWLGFAYVLWRVLPPTVPAPVQPASASPSPARRSRRKRQR